MTTATRSSRHLCGSTLTQTLPPIVMLMIAVIMVMMSGDLRLQLHITKPKSLCCHYVRALCPQLI